MMFLKILLCIVLLGGVVYMAISPKSSKMLRIAALCALALMVLSVIIAIIIALGREPTQELSLPIPDRDPAEKPTGPGTLTMVLFILSLVVFFVVIVFLSKREEKRPGKF